MAWDPAVSHLKCTACGNLQAVEASTGSTGEHSFDEALAHQHQITDAALEVRCDGCGAVFAFEPPQVAGACPFCAALIIMQPKAASPLVAPNALLPFKIRLEGSRNLVRGWIGSLWFAPNALTKMAQLDALKGVYLPYWSYSAGTVTQYDGERGDHYTETITERNAQGQMVQRQVVRVRWSPARGVVEGPFRDVLVVATKVVDARVTELEPWDLEALTAYEPAYLSGFQAQRYQVELPEGFEKAKRQMQPTIEGWIRSDIGGDEQRIHTRETRYSEVTFRHLLLPVWIGAYRFHGRVFQIAVNARTGEVQGDRPYSAAKITFLVLTILLVILVIAALSKNS
jgi:ribosomal protein S27E